MTTPENASSKQKGCLFTGLKVAGGLLVVLVLGVVGFGVALHKPLPEATPGPEADALGRKMLAAVNDDAWKKTGAIRWTFARGHEHLWDRERHLARVAWGDAEVHVDLNTRRGVAKRGGEVVEGEEATALIEQAWAMWANDSYWLNPVSKIFDEGTTRGVVEQEDGSRALLVTFGGGGVTPGDSYLWILDEAGRPTAWRMWVQIIPVGGVEASWEGWTRLDTGAMVAPVHETALVTLELKNIQAAHTLTALEPGPDPFAALLEGRGEEPAAGPTSRQGSP